MGTKENQDNNFQLPKKPKLAKLKKRPLAKRFKIRRAMKNCKWLPRVLYCLIRNRILFGPWLCSMSGGLARNRKCTTDKWPEEVVWRTQYRSAERQSLLFHCSSSEDEQPLFWTTFLVTWGGVKHAWKMQLLHSAMHCMQRVRWYQAVPFVRLLCQCPTMSLPRSSICL